jgi:hypothetical protein
VGELNRFGSPRHSTFGNLSVCSRKRERSFNHVAPDAILQAGGNAPAGYQHKVLSRACRRPIVKKATAVQRELRRPCGLYHEQLAVRRVISSGQPRETLAPKGIVCEPKTDFIFREVRRLADGHNEGWLTACVCFQWKGPRQLCGALKNGHAILFPPRQRWHSMEWLALRILCADSHEHSRIHSPPRSATGDRGQRGAKPARRIIS